MTVHVSRTVLLAPGRALAISLMDWVRFVSARIVSEKVARIADKKPRRRCVSAKEDGGNFYSPFRPPTVQNFVRSFEIHTTSRYRKYVLFARRKTWLRIRFTKSIPLLRVPTPLCSRDFRETSNRVIVSRERRERVFNFRNHPGIHVRTFVKWCALSRHSWLLLSYLSLIIILSR